MHIHLPKPLHGWRELLGEVGVIVIGVLIALGAEQAVEAIHHRSEVREAREALKDELGWNIASLRQTMDQSGCVLSRLNEIERWSKSFDAGHPMKLAGEIPVPSYYVFRSSIWRVTSGDAVGRMPLKERGAYAGLYDLLDAVEKQRDQMGEAWIDIGFYAGARRASEDQHLHVARDIQAIRTLYGVMGSNYQGALGIAKSLHVETGKLPISDWSKARKAAECQPLLAS